MTTVRAGACPGRRRSSPKRWPRWRIAISQERTERMSLPPPGGPHATGCVTYTLVDDTRPSHLLGTERGRRLRLKLWYPAARAYGAERELIWSDLRKRQQIPGPMRLLLSLLRQRTASRPAAPFASDEASLRLIVYNHGLVSFA